MESKRIHIEEIEEGTLAVADITLKSGVTVVRKDAELEGKHISLLKAGGITDIDVLVPEKNAVKLGTHIDDYPGHRDVLKKARVMIVDDSKLMRLKLRKIVEGAGLTLVGEAENGREAVEKAKELNPDFVTLDIEMPEVDGISTIEPLLEVVPEAKIIMISSLGEDDRIIESITCGALDYIIKPFDPDKVSRSIIKTIITDFPHI